MDSSLSQNIFFHIELGLLSLTPKHDESYGYKQDIINFF